MEEAVCGDDAPVLWGLISSVLEAKESGCTSKVAALTRVKDLLGGTLKLVNARIGEVVKEDAVIVLDDDMAGVTLGEMPDAQFLEPRGRFKTKLSSTGLFLEGKSASTFISWSHVAHCAVIPAHQSTKKEGEDIMVIHLCPDQVQFNGKPLKNVLWNMQKAVGKPISMTNKNEVPPSGPFLHESSLITGLVEHAWGSQVTRPRPDLFTTVAAKDSKPFLRCYKGTQEGAIYPLACGVVFIKPTLFLPAEEIASINAGRGGGSGQTRFVDLMVETADDSSYEFTNIDREELPALQAYVKGYLEVRAREAAEKRAAEAGAMDEDDDSDEDDDDYDGNDSGDSEAGSDDDDDSDDDSDDYADEDDDDDEETEDEKEEVKSEKKTAKSEKKPPSKEEAAASSSSKSSSPKKEKKEKEEKREKKARRESDGGVKVRKVSPKKRGSAAAAAAAPIKHEVTDLSSFSSSSSSSAAAAGGGGGGGGVDPVAAMKAAYQKSFQVKREHEGSENVPAASHEQNKKAKLEDKGGDVKPVQEGVAVAAPTAPAAPTVAVAAPASVFILE
jgi:hypothetical protein